MRTVIDTFQINEMNYRKIMIKSLQKYLMIIWVDLEVCISVLILFIKHHCADLINVCRCRTFNFDVAFTVY